MILKQQLIMTIGMTPNNWELTEEMVRNSIENFPSVPVIYNKNEKFKDYNKEYPDGDLTYPIGYILQEPNITIIENNVYADIFIFDRFDGIWNGKFNNWCIQFEDDINDKFKLFSIEVF